MGYRLAVVQHGDYADALAITESGQPEPYTGMHYSVRALESLFAGLDHLVVSLDAPSYHVHRPSGELVGFSMPPWKKAGKLPWSWMAYKAVRRFQPTHILMRTGGVVATPILHYARARNLDVMVMLAGYFMETSWRDRQLNKHLCTLFNDQSVHLVGNHRKPAADSLVAAGVKPEKVVAYDWPARVHPSEQPVRTAPEEGDERHVFFAGVMKQGKGIWDLVEAVILLNRSGVKTRLTAYGEGPDLPALREHVAGLEAGWISFPGRVSNDTILARMREASVVCMPSRKESSEGLPFVVTESLALRTPLIASDHPCLIHLLQDGEGLRFFPSGDVNALARTIREITDDPALYARLSEASASAYAKIECPTLFHELIESWRASWRVDEPKPSKANVQGLPGR
jgi:glycosyltransferase involved in cell wall biosynthesis